MGFAGQVFAARVAVGLAIPTPQAFSEAGKQIGEFSSKLYHRLNKENANAGTNNLQNAEANLAAARKKIAQHASKQDKDITAGAARAVTNLQQQYARLGKMSTLSTTRLKEIGEYLPKRVKTKLFQNIGEDMSDAQKYRKMMRNFMEMEEEKRQAVLDNNKEEIMALRSQINTRAKRAKMGKDAVNEVKDMIALRKEERDAYLHFDSIRKRMDKASGAELKALKKEEKDALKALDKVQEEIIENQKTLANTTQEWGQRVGYVAGEIKQNFNNSLRESVAALTAFYYKLNQNVQELVAFERELMNANSVFGITNDELFDVGNTVVEFGQKFGMEIQNGATGLYQLASAGLTANQAMQVLPETLKLSMAVQGDHNTISKLTAQTLFGFGMEMSQAGEITDKFAHAIQRSLIEYEDLSSAVKFALPFFTSTGQSIDQLLGALSVLTNRALEAGIAGRGLRQGLAELAESVGDNTAAFRKLGVEVTDSQGNMLQLTEIAANFAATLEEGVINDTELLTMLIEDLNVRGATAFVHLVQASDEFTAAVHDSANAGGELDEMVKIQNESMMAQIQILRNNVMAIFMLRDANYQGTEFMNAFHEAVIKGVASLKDLIVVETESGMVLTEMGQQIQDIAVQGIAMLIEVVEQIIPIIDQFTQSGGLNVELLKVYLIPLTLTVKAMDLLGPTIVKAVIAYSLLNKTLQLNIVLGALKNFLMEKEALNYVKNISLQGMWNAVSLKGIAIGIADTGWKVAGAIASGAWTLAVGAATLATSLFTAALWLNPMTWFVAACVAAVVIFAVMIYKFYDMTGLLHLMWAGFKALGSLIKWTGEVLYFFLLKPWVELGKIMADWLEGPAFKVMKFFENLVHMVKWVGDEIKNMMGKMGDIPIVGGLFKADGGMVNPVYAAGGATFAGNTQPYIVGERGPELFMPRQAGKIVPNKDLNTQRVNKMLQDAFDTAPRTGAAGIGQAQTLIVSSLNVGSADLKKTKLGVDVFG